MKRLLSVLALGALMNAPTAFAAVSDEVVQQLLDRLEAQEKRIAELEKATEKTQTDVEEQKQAVLTRDLNRAIAAHLGITRLWLHAQELRLDHPVTGAPLVLRAEPAPEWALLERFVQPNFTA